MMMSSFRASSAAAMARRMSERRCAGSAMSVRAAVAASIARSCIDCTFCGILWELLRLHGDQQP
jgi:hypothetical protein